MDNTPSPSTHCITRQINIKFSINTSRLKGPNSTHQLFISLQLLKQENMAAGNRLMSQASLGPFMDETVPGAPVPIAGNIRKIANHYYRDADWSPPNISTRVRNARGLQPGNNTRVRRLENKKLLLTIQPGNVGRNTYTYKCRNCGLRHDDDGCTINCYWNFRTTRFDVATNKLEIRRTNNIGNGNATPGAAPEYGIFVKAGQRIRRNEWLGEYIGRLIHPSHRGYAHNDYSYQLDTGDLRALPALDVDSQREGNWTRFMNHHCNPNIEVVHTQAGKLRMLCFRARQNIAANEEVFIHYGRRYFTSRQLYCECDYQDDPHLTTLNMGRVRR